MRRVLIFAAVSEVATGAGLLILPTLIVRLLLGVEPAGMAKPKFEATSSCEMSGES